MDDGQNARTIHCGNLNADKITEELLYELFLQAGPLERVSIPKDNGKNRQYGFVTYKFQCSVPYAMNVFSGTKLFNRELRLNNRCSNKNNNNGIENNQPRGNQMSNVPPPLLPNMPTTHQFQLQNPYGNDALRGGVFNNRGSAMNHMNNMMPTAFTPNLPLQFPQNAQIDYQTLLAQSAQMFAMANNMAGNNMANDNESHKHQSKMMHHHDSRPHNQNSNYNRDKDRRNDRNDRRRDRSKDRSRSLSRERTDWIRNKGKGSNSRSDRRDRNHRAGNNNRRR
ncbi:RNA-binding protein 7 [Contarinia nasturtii]|uniref:RNA-binding protein 7 n=1 Tax=Contarinia nasturtii TaxID=265458 RepID=UPI0012D3ADB8|nr:RNA-binding protein 7 [Contarinia nasturtii]